MNLRKILFLLVIFILPLASPAFADRSGGHGGGGSHSVGHWGWGGHRGGYYGRGYYGGRVPFYPRAYWGPEVYLGYLGWPYYYPPAYYYPPPEYYYPPPDYATPPSGEVTQPPAEGGQVFFYPRNGQSREQLSKDRQKCEAWAMEQSGVDLTKPPPSGLSEAQKVQKSQDYYRALEACMDGRGYTMR